MGWELLSCPKWDFWKFPKQFFTSAFASARQSTALLKGDSIRCPQSSGGLNSRSCASFVLTRGRTRCRWAMASLPPPLALWRSLPWSPWPPFGRASLWALGSCIHAQAFPWKLECIQFLKFGPNEGPRENVWQSDFFTAKSAQGDCTLDSVVRLLFIYSIFERELDGRFLSGVVWVLVLARGSKNNSRNLQVSGAKLVSFVYSRFRPALCLRPNDSFCFSETHSESPKVNFKRFHLCHDYCQRSNWLVGGSFLNFCFTK